MSQEVLAPALALWQAIVLGSTPAALAGFVADDPIEAFFTAVLVLDLVLVR